MTDPTRTPLTAEEAAEKACIFVLQLPNGATTALTGIGIIQALEQDGYTIVPTGALAAAATAERERIAAALPDALGEAMCLSRPYGSNPGEWAKVAARHIIDQPPLRALLQPEGE